MIAYILFSYQLYTVYVDENLWKSLSDWYGAFSINKSNFTVEKIFLKRNGIYCNIPNSRFGYIYCLVNARVY